jgi:hypothetical protein
MRAFPKRCGSWPAAKEKSFSEVLDVFLVVLHNFAPLLLPDTVVGRQDL